MFIWFKETDDLEKALIKGIVSGKFLMENASNPDWYLILFKIAERGRDPICLRKMVRGILKCGNFEKRKSSGSKKIIGIGSSSLKILSLLKNSEIATRNNIILLDNDEEIFKESPFINIKLPWAKMFFTTESKEGNYVPLSWGGVHHGGPDLSKLMALGLTDKIAKIFENVDDAVMVANLGGATGSGAAPVVAAILKEMAIRVVAILQLPFPFEFGRRLEAARESLEIFHELANKIIVINGAEVLKKIEKNLSILDVFKKLDLEMANLTKIEYCSFR